MKWSVGTRIGAGYALALLMLFSLGVISYQTTTELVHVAELRSRAHEMLLELDALLSALTDAETGQRGYVIVGEERYLEPYQAGTRATNQAIVNLRRLTADNPNQQRRLDALELIVASKIAELNETIDLRKSKGFDAALQVIRSDKGKKAMDDVRRLVAEMGNEEKALRALRDREVNPPPHQHFFFFFFYTLAFFFVFGARGLCSRAPSPTSCGKASPSCHPRRPKFSPPRRRLLPVRRRRPAR